MAGPSICHFPASPARLVQSTTRHSRGRATPQRKLSHTPQRTTFHDYFVVRLPSSSVHPDSRPRGPHHKLPRQDSVPHSPSQARAERSPIPSPIDHGSPDTTTVRIPLQKAKHHFGAATVRGTRPYNEDTYQAGTIEIPAFAKRAPLSVRGKPRNGGAQGEQEAADSATGDPQVFYFGVFDGHGGSACSNFLRGKLHEYVESSSSQFGLESSLQAKEDKDRRAAAQQAHAQEEQSNQASQDAPSDTNTKQTPEQVEKSITSLWRETVGGYFRRFKPIHFTEKGGGQGIPIVPCIEQQGRLEEPSPGPDGQALHMSIANVLTHAFLKADYDFVTSQTGGKTELGGPGSSKGQSAAPPQDELDPDEEPLGRHHHHSSDSTPFLGGSTCSAMLISTPSPTPFWHPSSPFTLVTAHVGDTRILLCSTSSGAPLALTSTHHPSAPVEATRLRRFAGAFTTDSFGEERMSGLANTRAFGDVRSKRIGVSAEPEIKLVYASPAAFSFIVLVSDGVTLALSDQEIVDVVKEAKTPEQGAADVVALATELAASEKGDADNATAMVVRLGGWERRSEGGGGSMGTREKREWRRSEADDPRRGRT